MSSSGRQPVDVISGPTGASALQMQGAAAGNAAAVGNPVLTGAKYNASAPTFDDGDVGELQIDASGYLRTTLATLITGENQTLNRLMAMPSCSFNNIITNTTTVVKTGAGILYALILGDPRASEVITIYDNTAASGTLIGTITLPATLLTDVTYYLFGVAFSTGLTIVTATGAAVNLTVAYV